MKAALTLAALLAGSAAAATHELELTVVLFRGTGWTYAQVEPHFARINEILAPCALRLSTVTLVEADAYKGILDVSAMFAGEDREIAAALPKATPRPVVFLMRNLPSQHNAYAGIPSYALAPLDPALHNAIFVSNHVNSDEWWYYRDMDESGRTCRLRMDPGYDVFAHELAHLLADAGHELPGQSPDLPKGAKNLLAGDKSEVDGSLLPRQCAAFRKSPLARQL